jgi:hypothetical protein
MIVRWCCKLYITCICKFQKRLGYMESLSTWFVRMISLVIFSNREKAVSWSKYVLIPGILSPSPGQYHRVWYGRCTSPIMHTDFMYVVMRWKDILVYWY